jgi:phosphoserine phosphatase RsbU/P
MRPGRPSLAQCRVLVVEDDVCYQQFLIGHLLEEMGIRHIVFAEDGIDGLEKARATPPDIIILDIHMPRMDGMEMLRHLRADPKLERIPVIVQTAIDSGDHRETTFSAGATDFVTKPLYQGEFQSRVRTHLENRLLIGKLETDLHRLTEEMEDAASLQIALLPGPDILAGLQSRYGLSIAARFSPSSLLGGDFWGIIPIDDTHLAVFICDFAGHGVSAALNTFRLHTMINRLPAPSPSNPAAYLQRLNEGLCGVLTNRHYATFLLGIVDFSAHTFTYSAAGAPDPLTGPYRPGAEIHSLSASGMPLGLVASSHYDNRTATFVPGSFLFLFSDVLTDSQSEAGLPVGVDGVRRVVGEVLAAPKSPPLPQILERFGMDRHEMLKDDLTAIWLHWEV